MESHEGTATTIRPPNPIITQVKIQLLEGMFPCKPAAHLNDQSIIPKMERLGSFVPSRSVYFSLCVPPRFQVLMETFISLYHSTANVWVTKRHLFPVRFFPRSHVGNPEPKENAKKKALGFCQTFPFPFPFHLSQFGPSPVGLSGKRAFRKVTNSVHSWMWQNMSFPAPMWETPMKRKRDKKSFPDSAGLLSNLSSSLSLVTVRPQEFCPVGKYGKKERVLRKY